MKVSQTRLAEWRRCRQRYDWHYVSKIAISPSPGQLRGRAGHAALAAYYEGKTVEQSIGLGLLELLPLGLEGTKDRQLMTAILQRYFQYAKANDNWKVVAVEKELLGRVGRHELQGFVDLLVEIDGELVIIDHKFQRNGTVEGTLLSPQLAMYSELVRQNYRREAHKVMYNVVRTTLGGVALATPVVRIPAKIVPARHKLWQQELIAQSDEIERYHKGGEAAPAVYRNQTGNCNWDCSFYQRCLTLDTGGEPDDASPYPGIELTASPEDSK